jgi:hypothetical protein
LVELREKKYKEWIERKDQQVMLANEFNKLKADGDEMGCGESSSSINNGDRVSDHRAFQRYIILNFKHSTQFDDLFITNLGNFLVLTCQTIFTCFRLTKA